jgi:hypothetical protein
LLHRCNTPIYRFARLISGLHLFTAMQRRNRVALLVGLARLTLAFARREIRSTLIGSRLIYRIGSRAALQNPSLSGRRARIVSH